MEQRYELVDIDSVSPHPENPRRGDLNAIGALIDDIGFYGAVIVQLSTGLILVGNHRWKSMKAKGAKQIPVLWIDVDDDRARRILAADNRASDLGGYDAAAMAILADELPDGLLDVLGLSRIEQLAANPKVAHDDGSANPEGSGSEESYGERLAGFKASLVRSLVLDFTLVEYDEIMAAVPELLRFNGVETLSELLWVMIFPGTPFVEPDPEPEAEDAAAA